MERLSLSLPADVVARIRLAAREDGDNLSAWFLLAAETQLLNREARRVIAGWEAEQGTISDDELERAERAWRSREA